MFALINLRIEIAGLKSLLKTISMRRSLLLAIQLSVFSIFMACTKEGPAGKDGNANVKTVTFGVQPYQWSGNNGFYYYHHEIPQITDDVYENGDVRVYMKASDAESYQALPLTSPNFNLFKYWYSVGSVDLHSQFEDPNVTEDFYTEFKVVIFGGNPYYKSLNLNDYEAVKAHFHLED